METRSARGQGRGRGIPLPTQGRDTIDPPILPVLPIIPIYNLVHSSHGVTWDNDLIERLMIIFEETYIQINKISLSATHWNQVWGDFNM
jgi:hypothetical protein